ncbi:MAG: N-acetyl-gamma-glutamyl-phosphate reductase [Clostridia bacterium]|nr:N-acetyl-gamma-glutamyl-phosphate reductase [Clostridia bacterium]
MHKRPIQVYIDGQEGTTGLRLREQLGPLLDRKEVELLLIPPEKRKDAEARAAMMESSDATFLCLPDAAAVEAAELCRDPRVVLFDASTAHRTSPGWAYGFPELSPEHERAVRESNRIAVPGCHASGFLSLVYPLRAAGILPADYPLVCYSLTGYTGGGKNMIAEYEAPDRSPLLDAPRQYGLSQNHKHLREMVHVANLSRVPIFAPIVADFPQGMQTSIPLYADLLSERKTPEEIHAVLASHYERKGHVHVLPFGESFDRSFASANLLRDSNELSISVHGNEDRILLLAHFDNLGKGASGAAVQCLRLRFGLSEDA